MVELKAIAVNEADGGVRTEQRNGEHFYEVSTDLNGRTDLILDFGSPRRATFILLAKSSVRTPIKYVI